MQSVLVDFTNPRRPYEIQRDARDPYGPDVEHLADVLSARDRTVRVYETGPYVPGWRHGATVIYEAHAGTATPDYRSGV
jgi:hypothetical protein